MDLASHGDYDSILEPLKQTSWERGDEISTNYSGDIGLNDSDFSLCNGKNDGESQFYKWTDLDKDSCKLDGNINFLMNI